MQIDNFKICSKSVAVRRLRGPDKWDFGTVMHRLGLVSYIVDINGYPSHVHVGHLICAPENGDVQINRLLPDPLEEAPVTMTTTNRYIPPDTERDVLNHK